MAAGPEMFTTGAGVTVTLIGTEVAAQPLASVTVTVTLPDADTVIDWVVAPVDQRYAAPELAVSVTLPPGQKVVGPDAVIVAGSGWTTVTLVGADVALQPPAFVTVTECEPVVLTVIDGVVAPLDQR